MKRLFLSSLLMSLSFAWPPAWSKQPVQLVTEDFHVASETPGAEFSRSKLTEPWMVARSWCIVAGNAP